MKTPNYKYKVVSEPDDAALATHINMAVENGWDLVPGQSVAVVPFPHYHQDGIATDTLWVYTVIMRTLA